MNKIKKSTICFVEEYEYKRFEKIINKHHGTDLAIRHLAYRKASGILFLYNSRSANSILVASLEDMSFTHALNISNDYGMSLITEL